MNMKEMLYTLWNKLSDDIIIVDNVSVGEMTMNASGAASKTLDVSASIPDGYELKAVTLRTTGSYWCYCYSLAVQSSTSIAIYLFRATSSNTKTTPIVTLICKKI